MELTLVVLVAGIALFVDVIVELGRKGVAKLKAKAAETDTTKDDELVATVEDIIRKIVAEESDV